MSYVTLTGDPETLATFDDEISDRLNDALRINAEYLLEVMKGLTPVRTGETQASLGIEEAWLEYDVGSDSPVFQWLDEGTQGHGPIIPRNAQALHWTEGGEDIFAKYVLYVSGIEALNIRETALEMAEPVMDANIEEAIDAAWSDAGE